MRGGEQCGTLVSSAHGYSHARGHEGTCPSRRATAPQHLPPASAIESTSVAIHYTRHISVLLIHILPIQYVLYCSVHYSVAAAPISVLPRLPTSRTNTIIIKGT